MTAMGTSYAYFRLPYADSYTLISSSRPTLRIDRLEELGTQPGFVLAPFHESEAAPALLIRPDEISVIEIMSSDASRIHDRDIASDLTVDQRYSTAFEAYHSAVSDGRFRKLVLARSKTVALPFAVDAQDPESSRSLFEKACRMYPRLMVMLYHTPESGTWLVASPEILMDSTGHIMHTVALAGTMPFAEGHIQWSEKNKHEQHVVEQYIESILQDCSDSLVKDGPVTSRAGDLVHLRTDFRFHLRDGVTLGTLVSRLHPTPAVCGMPKREAADFIATHEGLDRSYYSGFAGPVGINSQTHLYVALRCAHLISPQQAVLYAGGGIMPDSDCRSEWLETESKFKTIRNVLQ